MHIKFMNTEKAPLFERRDFDKANSFGAAKVSALNGRAM